MVHADGRGGHQLALLQRRKRAIIRRGDVRLLLVEVGGVAERGFADDVDHHWWRILSGVALGTLLSATAQRSQGDVSEFQPTFPQLWASNAAGSINSAGQQLTQKNLQIQPTIKVRPGFTVNVLVSKDIVIAPSR
jgi:type IV secretory pathway VirB10-like protein